MEYRRFGRTNWSVSEIGYGMWGLAGWKGTEDAEVKLALEKSVALGCNFFDTAWAYGSGKSEEILGKLLKQYRNKSLHIATKIPPANFKWPARPTYPVSECFSEQHIIEYTEKSLQNLGVDVIDLQQFHVWEDAWANADEWKNGITKLKQAGKVKHFGISVNRWEPNNVLKTLETGLIDAIQVIYNIFDQAPEDNLFPVCRKLDIGVIARVPFDEGTLTGNLTKETTFPEGDWRATYFVRDNLTKSVEHAEALRPLVPPGMTMAELALQFILNNDDVHTTIPGMRTVKHVDSNMGSSGKKPARDLVQKLRGHRWDRTPTSWSQ